MRAVRKCDRLIGEILAFVESDPLLSGHTAIIVTADHGGTGHHHKAGEREHYTIPFYVWAPGVPAGDLYSHNAAAFLDPGADRPGFAAPLQPVRNGAAANLALTFLGLDLVPGSIINAEGVLRVQPESPVTRGEADYWLLETAQRDGDPIP